MNSTSNPQPGRPEFWRGVWNDLKMTYYLLRDSRVPLPAKLVPAFVALYLFSPLDLVPGFIPVLGQMDDLAVLMFGLRIFQQLVPDYLRREYQEML